MTSLLTSLDRLAELARKAQSDGHPGNYMSVSSVEIITLIDRIKSDLAEARNSALEECATLARAKSDMKFALAEEHKKENIESSVRVHAQARVLAVLELEIRALKQPKPDGEG